MDLQDKVLSYLNLIDKKKDLNCFLEVYEKESVQRAIELNEKINSKKKVGKLAGKIIAVKDVISIAGKKLTASSKYLKDFIGLYDAYVIDKIIEEDGIIIGKTNCDEFAMGSSNENSFFGAVLNPIDKSRVPGGSSGGSAVAVAADLCDIALGSDTGGSIRQPASFCGVYGLKPTYGRVSRYGLIAFASSFDSIGIFAKNIEDIALTSEVIFGHDKRDSTSMNLNVPKYSELLNDIDKEIKIGLPKEYFLEELNPEIKEKIFSQINELKKLGCKFIDISLPHTKYAIATYYILTTAEASSNLSRYDGMRYGFRDKEMKNLDLVYKKSRTESLGKEVKRRIMLGTYVLSAGYYNAYYLKAQKVRRLIQNDFLEAFKYVDCILTPTAPSVAFKLNEKLDDPLQMYLGDIYTTSVNLAGLPALNLPIETNSENLPIGMQIIGNHFDELLLMKLAKLSKIDYSKELR